jgi:HNH endonuclease
MGTSRRRRQSPAASALEACTGGGGAIGLLLAASIAAKHPPTASRCPPKDAGLCFGQQTSQMLHPYLVGGLVGAAIGLAVGTLVLIAWAKIRRPKKHRADAVEIRSRPSNSVGPGRASIAPPARRRQAIPERIRHEVWRRDEACCVDCGSRERLEFDHIIPVSKGGSNTARNIELRCETCNGRKGARV